MALVLPHQELRGIAGQTFRSVRGFCFGKLGRYGCCNRLSVLYFPFSEMTPSDAPAQV